jgi:hypothetical protein
VHKTCAFAIIALLALAPAAPAQVRINEIRTDNAGFPAGSDGSEFFELAGPPGTPLAGLTYLVLGDAAGSFGAIEFVFSLGSLSIAANGLLAVQIIPSSSGPFPQCTCTGGCAPFLYFPLSFENSDNVTHLLVSDFTGMDGDDLDSDDDGTLDVTPWSGIVDSVALLDVAVGGDLVYSSTQVGPDPVNSGQPWHVYFCAGSGWQIGTGSPACATDTVGEPNGCGATSVAATVSASSWVRVKATYR